MFDQRVSIHTIAFGADDFDSSLETMLDAGIPSLGYLWSRLPQRSDLPDVSHVTTPPMFTLDRPNEWPRQQRRLLSVLDQAAALGAEVVYGITGPAGSLSWREAARAFARAVAPVVAHAEELGLPLLIETTNQLRQELNFAYTLRDLVALADLSGVGICCDLLWCWREPDIEKLISATAHRTGLVQVSDYVPGMVSMPDRAVPGDGIIPLGQLVGAYLQAGYRGRFDVELTGPRIDAEGPAAACLRGAAMLTELLRSLSEQEPGR